MEACVFCQIVRGEIPSWKVIETKTTFAFFDINPVNEFHTLVIPKAHYADIFEVPEKVLLDVMSTVKGITNLFKAKLGITDVQIVNSSGAHAQQDVFHLHFHVLPRQENDGQDIQWETHPEYRERFDEWLTKLKD